MASASPASPAGMMNQAAYMQQQQQQQPPMQGYQQQQQHPQAGPSSAPYQAATMQMMNGASPQPGSQQPEQQQHQQQHPGFNPSLPASFDREKLGQMSMVSWRVFLLVKSALLFLHEAVDLPKQEAFHTI